MRRRRDVHVDVTFPSGRSGPTGPGTEPKGEETSLLLLQRECKRGQWWRSPTGRRRTTRDGVERGGLRLLVVQQLLLEVVVMVVVIWLVHLIGR